jgi:hypothetical protein
MAQQNFKLVRWPTSPNPGSRVLSVALNTLGLMIQWLLYGEYLLSISELSDQLYEHYHSCPHFHGRCYDLLVVAGEASSVEQMAHAASARKTPISLGFTELSISISDACKVFIEPDSYDLDIMWCHPCLGCTNVLRLLSSFVFERF